LIILDTTILVYAKGADHDLRDPCRRLIEAVGRRQIDASTTPEVIQEFAHIRSRRRTRTDAAELAVAYADLLAPLVAVQGQHLRAGLRIFERNEELGAFDAVLAALALETGAEALVSADESFAVVDGLRTVAPGTAAFEAMLAG
jgi:predicted nucleic acid-binding protein